MKRGKVEHPAKKSAPDAPAQQPVQERDTHYLCPLFCPECGCALGEIVERCPQCRHPVCWEYSGWLTGSVELRMCHQSPIRHRAATSTPPMLGYDTNGRLQHASVSVARAKEER